MINKFDNQKIKVSNNKFEIELCYEHWSANDKKVKDVTFDQQIEITKTGQFTSALGLNVEERGNKTRNCLITGLGGGCYLHIVSENDRSQTVKLDDEDLILSVGDTLLSFNLSTMALNWQVCPDGAELFEFYDLEGDILLRGEIEIHRISKKGNVIWSYGGRDIWVNIDGKKEVEIQEDRIKLIDFESNEYWIDFNGKTLKDNPHRAC
jgi:hypothetical protein